MSYYQRLLAALEEAGRLDPGERFERMVKNGFINRRGELTKAHGGTAEPENAAGKGDGMSDQKPSIGRIVHYVLPKIVRDYVFHDWAVGEHRPGIIVSTWDGSFINLQVFFDGSNDAPIGDGAAVVWVTSVSQDEETKAPGTWHWPERV